MQRRAAAIYGVVLVLVAAGAFAFAATADGPEPAFESFDAELEEGDEYTVDDRQYTVTGFGERRGEPTATFEWIDEDARSDEAWDHAADPGGTTVFTGGSEYWVRIPQDADEDEELDSFTLLEVPPEDVSVFMREDDGQWFVQPEGEDPMPIEEYDLERITIQSDEEFTVHNEEGEDEREVLVEEITTEAVAVSWNEPEPQEEILRQSDRNELNGVTHMAHFPEEGVVQVTTDEAEMERYTQQREDRELFQQRIGGLHLTIVISLLTVVLLFALAYLPRKE